MKIGLKYEHWEKWNREKSAKIFLKYYIIVTLIMMMEIISAPLLIKMILLIPLWTSMTLMQITYDKWKKRSEENGEQKQQ